MDDTPLGVVREAVTRLVQECNDADLLDLLCKLLLESSAGGTTDAGRPFFISQNPSIRYCFNTFLTTNRPRAARSGLLCICTSCVC